MHLAGISLWERPGRAGPGSVRGAAETASGGLRRGAAAPWLPAMPLLKSAVGRLRVAGFLEGMSFLVLLGIAMPLKYLAGRPEAVRVVGMAHGVLFILYVTLVVLARREQRWPARTTFWLLAAAFLPCGPFVADARLLRERR